MATDLDVIANLTGASVTEAQMKTWFTAMRAALAEMGDPLGVPGKLQNLSLALSVGASALTIALKDRDGSDPAAASPASAAFRNVTVATGDFNAQNVIAANSLVVSSSSTLGTRDGIPFRLWIVLFNDGGTLRLGVINCLTTVAGAGSGSDVTAVYPLSAWGIASSTAEGGAGAADSAQVFYTGSTVTSKAFVVLGYATWESGLATAGTWSAGPTRVQLFGAGVPLPGQTVQVQRTQTGAFPGVGSSTIPLDDTIPQNTEGDQYMTQAITPNSAANVLSISHVGNYAYSVAVSPFITALFQDSVANALAAVSGSVGGANWAITVPLRHVMLAATTISTTMKIRAGGASAGTTTFNGAAGVRQLGGALASILAIEELVG